MSLFDDNAEVLRRLEADGRNLGPAREVDFSLVFPDQASADAFAAVARRSGFKTVVRRLNEDWHDPDVQWDVTATKEMRPTCEHITDTETMLARAAGTYGGRADGWGFFDPA